MRIGLRISPALLAAVLFVIGPAGDVVQAADQPAASGSTAPIADQQLYDLFRDVINRGADLYNTGDRNGCYRLFQGALMAARPMLANRPDLQKAIDTGMADAERAGSVGERAYALRKVLDDVRAKVNPRTKKGADPSAGRSQPELTPPLQLKTVSLWDRLGGEKAVKKVIDDFVDLAAADPKANFSRNGKFKPDAAAVALLKGQLLDFFSQATGGPYAYHGKNMKEAHRGMGITNAEFDALAADLKKALEKNGAKAADVEQVMQAVGGTRGDIVETPKPAPKK